jgi:hypothetical protein
MRFAANLLLVAATGRHAWSAAYDGTPEVQTVYCRGSPSTIQPMPMPVRTTAAMTIFPRITALSVRNGVAAPTRDIGRSNGALTALLTFYLVVTIRLPL